MPSANTNYTLRGRAVKSGTAEPVPDLTVQAFDFDKNRTDDALSQAVQTDADGRFEIGFKGREAGGSSEGWPEPYLIIRSGDFLAAQTPWLRLESTEHDFGDILVTVDQTEGELAIGQQGDPPSPKDPSAPASDMPMHGQKTRDVVAPRSPFYRGPFGRMFRELLPWEPPGADETAKLKVLRDLAATMVDAGDQSGDNEAIPAGYTYFGQFVDHDITFDPGSSFWKEEIMQYKFLRGLFLRSLGTLVITILVSLAFAQGKIAREPLTIDFGDFQTKAELTHPVQGKGPFPAVILIPGSGPEDMNASIFSFGADGKPIFLSSIFKQVSSHLSENGFAVLRYNKHYVTGPGQADFEKFYTQLDMQQMLADAGKVLAKAEANPKVKKGQIFLYGWSEGSAVAAALAAKHPELAGLIVQGPVSESWRGLFLYQILSVGLPYVRQASPDERVSVDTLKALQTGDGGLVAKGILNYLGDPVKFQRGKLAVNPALDTDKDRVLEKSELTPKAFGNLLDTYFTPQGFAAIYTPERALPDVTQQAPNLKLPVLILQGANDANVPASGAKMLDTALEKAGNPDPTLEVYPKLGHSLGETSSVITDNFQPIAKRPLEDLVAWLEAHIEN